MTGVQLPQGERPTQRQTTLHTVNLEPPVNIILFYHLTHLKHKLTQSVFKRRTFRFQVSKNPKFKIDEKQKGAFTAYCGKQKSVIYVVVVKMCSEFANHLAGITCRNNQAHRNCALIEMILCLFRYKQTDTLGFPVLRRLQRKAMNSRFTRFADSWLNHLMNTTWEQVLERKTPALTFML